MVDWILNFTFSEQRWWEYQWLFWRPQYSLSHDMPVKIVTKYSSSYQNKSFKIVKSGPHGWCFKRHDDDDDQWHSKETKTDWSWKTILRLSTKFFDCGGNNSTRHRMPKPFSGASKDLRRSFGHFRKISWFRKNDFQLFLIAL